MRRHAAYRDPDFKELEDAFKWNAEVKTAFKDIQPEKASVSPAQKVVEATAEMIKATKELAETVVAGKE